MSTFHPFDEPAPPPPHRRRSQARVLAVQSLCLYDALGEAFRQQLDEFLHDTIAQHDLGLPLPLPHDVIAFARTLAEQTWRHRQRYDDLLAKAVPHWTTRRMPPVDRNILRLGLHELLEHPETPAQVVLNEAIELARQFADADSPGFVNGVLDAIRRELGIAGAPAEA